MKKFDDVETVFTLSADHGLFQGDRFKTNNATFEVVKVLNSTTFEARLWRFRDRLPTLWKIVSQGWGYYAFGFAVGYFSCYVGTH